MNRKRNNLLLVAVATIVITIGFSGCSKPKVIEYKPYQSNARIYGEMVEKNKLEWRASLIDDVEEYRGYISTTFNKIDSHKSYLERTHNINVVKINKQNNEKKGNKISYGDVIFDDEYTF
jgi:hypothetical protein